MGVLFVEGAALATMQLGDWIKGYGRSVTGSAHAPLLNVVSDALSFVGAVAGASMVPTIFNEAGKAWDAQFSQQPTTNLNTSPDVQHHGQVVQSQREHAM